MYIVNRTDQFLNSCSVRLSRRQCSLQCVQQSMGIPNVAVFPNHCFNHLDVRPQLSDRSSSTDKFFLSSATMTERNTKRGEQTTPSRRYFLSRLSQSCPSRVLTVSQCKKEVCNRDAHVLRKETRAYAQLCPSSLHVAPHAQRNLSYLELFSAVFRWQIFTSCVTTVHQMQCSKLPMFHTPQARHGNVSIS